jgi:hypothetical protein
VAAVTAYSAPEDGCKGRPKHVEHTCSFYKHNTARVASCWFIIYYITVITFDAWEKNVRECQTVWCQMLRTIILNVTMTEYHM